MASKTDKTPPKDPIVDRSLAPHFLAFSGLLLATVAWTVVDEVWVRRPYKAIQSEFLELAEIKAKSDLAYWSEKLEEEKETEAYEAAKEEHDELTSKEAVAERAAERKKLLDRRTEIEKELNIVRGDMQVVTGEYQPLVYDYEHAKLEGHEDAAQALTPRIDELKPKIAELQGKFLALNNEKTQIGADLQKLSEEVSKAEAALKKAAPSQAMVDQTQRIVKEGFDPSFVESISGIQQYHIEELNDRADRCTSCHVAADRLGYDEESWERARGDRRLRTPEDKARIDYAKRVFSSHPNLGTEDRTKFDAFASHNPREFGCTACHLGNGPATIADKAHGLEGDPRHAWLHPRHYELEPMLPTSETNQLGRMFEASCHKCHDQQLYLKGAPQLTLGRELVEDVGCVGCHKMKGFRLEETEQEELRNKLDTDLKKRFKKLTDQLANEELDLDPAAIKREIARLGQEIANAEARIEELDLEVKFIGPDLNRKDAGALRSKIYPRWLPRWIANPQHFRPGTKMPNPLLAENQDPEKSEVLAVAAYIWQQAGGQGDASAKRPTFPKAVVDEGRWLAHTVGCVACHSLEAGPGGTDDVAGLAPTELDGNPERFAVYDMPTFFHGSDGKLVLRDGTPKPERPALVKRGPTFGPSLAKIGEKARYDWLVTWLIDPKAVQPHTSMPSLRLSEDEAKKIAAYLTTLGGGAPGGERYASLEMKVLEDPKLAATGERLIRRYGCYNCHAIDMRQAPSGGELPPVSKWPAWEGLGKIGIELSSHGSKPLAQFDFGFIELSHYRPVWFMAKVLEPRIWDTGKYKRVPDERLIMPRFGLSKEEAQAAVTVISGLTTKEVPGRYLYRPGARGKAIIAGERVVKKYNCRSCHEIDGRGGWGHEAIQAAVKEAFKDGEVTKRFVPSPLDPRDYAPPTLSPQGLRTRPEWLFHFLKDPGDLPSFRGTGGGKIRPFHVVRMPTFELSDHEAQVLVEYFNALQGLEDPYPQNPEPEPALVELGRKVFKENTCNKCHAIGGSMAEQHIGPNLMIARARMRSDWFHRFIPDPQSYIPGTNMPSPWGSKPFFLLEPPSAKEVRAVTEYVRMLSDPAFRKAEGY